MLFEALKCGIYVYVANYVIILLFLRMNGNICLRAALVPDSQVENTPCILDVDMFHLLVRKH